jgi:hypothetical protein
VSESAGISGFENLKADPGRPGVDNFQGEIGKLRAIRAIGLRAEPFAEVPWKVLQMFCLTGLPDCLQANGRETHPC